MMKLDLKNKQILINIPFNFGRIKRFWAKVNKRLPLFIITGTILLSIASWFYFYSKGIVVAYNDARAHLNMSRLVFDNLKPGLAQMGSVWLPLLHVLELSTIWNYWMWQTGLSGSIVSMTAYVLSVIFIFKFLATSLKGNLSVFLGTLFFATNLNILYMQSTPMTEALLILFFIAATYYLYKWYKEGKLIDLILLSFSVFASTLTRYDGWFLFGVIGTVIFLALIKKNSHKVSSLKLKLKNIIIALPKIEGNLILYFTLGGFGIALWFLWNLLIFGDPLYFALGPFSAHAQQARIEAAGSLPTKYNLLLSFRAFWWSMVNNVGFLPLILAIAGLILFLYKNKFSAKSLIILTLLAPFAFHIISLYFGHSILVLPELGVKITEKASASWFNVRYGLTILPAVSFFAAYLASKDKIVRLIFAALIVLQPYLFISENNIITITDGVQGTSSLEVGDVAQWLKDNAQDKNQEILTSISFNNALAYTTGFPLKRFIHEGTGIYWETSLSNPAKYADWIVMANGDVGDPVYNALIKEGNSKFLTSFSLVQKFEHLNIYQKRQIPENFVYIEDNEFKLEGKIYRFLGVNSYDLLYKSPEEIGQTIASAKDAGIKVIRFWVFGEGFADGTQPREGIYNEDRLKVLDYILKVSDENDIKLILTLSNYWEDYGGISEYLSWQGFDNQPQQKDLFFTDDKLKEIYQNYINHIVLRKNTLTGVYYKDDRAIFAWELMNEPRVLVPSERQDVLNWLDENSNFIKKLDKYHIILTGSEGASYSSDQFIANSYPTLSQVSSLDSVKALTFHYYIRNPKYLSITYQHPTIAEVKSYSDEVKKPLIVEEVGFSKNTKDNNGISREVVYKSFLDQINSHGVQGVVLWNWALKVDDNYGISPLDPRDSDLINIIRNYAVSISNPNDK